MFARDYEVAKTLHYASIYRSNVLRRKLRRMRKLDDVTAPPEKEPTGTSRHSLSEFTVHCT